MSKLEGKAGTFVSTSDDKYPTHRKHTEGAGNFKAEITRSKYTEAVTVT